MFECTKRGCRDIREEKDPMSYRIRRICNECGRTLVTITYQEANMEIKKAPFQEPE